MIVTDSNDRRSKILIAVVEDYIDTASPVGSQTICRKHRLGVSSATVRNIFGELEAAGLITQPHTSAGRIPTDRGYRYYVNAIHDLLPLDQRQLTQIHEILAAPEAEVERILDRAARVMAELTHQAAVVLYPVLKRSAFKRLEVVPLDARRLLCVLVTTQGLVRSIIIEVDEPVTGDELQALLRFLNNELAGMALDEVETFLQRRILAQADSFFYLLKRALHIIHATLEADQQEQLRLEGASYVLAQPEFHDAQKTQALLQMLEARDDLVVLLQEDLAHDGVAVHIGHEMEPPALEECSLVTAPYKVRGQTVGGLGILGPRRMAYPRLMATVDCVARRVGELLNQVMG